ncbi:rnp-8 [Pristionchus pacificus]|uniref:Rnp-8 n=1 Tax=Pristionchus pacificus TaxID=54126 RepID=A0A2A6C881_PRIPA|nr:rnp-8 [Pristionchus pacificus]|eukprot:PDM74231.1 rnp-8 [Pristionchus pacificus]
MDNHFDRRERTIYVWMLERNVTDDQLYSLFSKIGPIEKLIFKEYADGTPQHCLIVFRYVDSVLTAMSTLQSTELNGKPISLRPLRESTHAVLMPPSTMYPSKERTTTVTSSDGLSDDHSEDHCGEGVGKKLRTNWDAVSTAGSDSSCAWKVGDGIEAAVEKLTLAERSGDTVGSRSSTSFSSVSSGPESPSHSLSPSSQQHLRSSTSSAIHASLRKPWRPSRGPIPAPLLTSGSFSSRHLPANCSYTKDESTYGAGSSIYASHTNLAHYTAGSAPPPSLFSQIIPPSPGYGSHSPYAAGGSLQSFAGGNAAPSPRPLLPEMYRPAGRPPAAMGVFSPTAAPEEVLWRQHNGGPSPPPGSVSTPLMSSCTSEAKNWFDYGGFSVPQAYRGNNTEQQVVAAPATVTTCGQTAHKLPHSLGGMLPPNSPPIAQCTRFFDFTAASATLPRLRPYHPSLGGGPSSARPHASPFVSARCEIRAPRSAALVGAGSSTSFHEQHPNSPFSWPEFRTFGGRY